MTATYSKLNNISLKLTMLKKRTQIIYFVAVLFQQVPAIIRVCNLLVIYYAQVAFATCNRGSKNSTRLVRFIIWLQKITILNIPDILDPG